jgi:predicted dehydrogenase
VGEQNAYVIEVHGSTGSLAWDFRRMGELRVCLDQDYQAASWSTRIMRPADGESGAFQPDTALPLSYDDLKVIEVKRLIAAIATGKAEGATIADMARTARLVDATLRSYAEQRWIDL